MPEDITLHEMIEEVRRRLRENAGSRELSLAITKLDECEMWADKAGAV